MRLEDHFELYEFPNDLARWCWTALGDYMLGEQLGLLDPYQEPSTPTCARLLINVIEDRLWGLDRVPWCRPGLELHLVESRLIAYDTGERIRHPGGPAARPSSDVAAVAVLPRPRSAAADGRQTDDFSFWLEQCGAERLAGGQLAGDRLLLPQPGQLRQALLEAFRAVGARGGRRHPEGRAMKLLDRYEEIVGHQEVERLRRLAERLSGKRMVHVNSTRTGGGVAEILGWMIPLMEELGIDARWEIDRRPAGFLPGDQGAFTTACRACRSFCERAISICTTK